MRHTYLLLVYLILFGAFDTLHIVSAAVVYGITYETNAAVSINISTGAFTLIAKNTDKNEGLYTALSCFDQKNEIFYYLTLNELFPVDVAKHKVLPVIKYGHSAIIASCEVNTSNVLVASDLGYGFEIFSYPLASDHYTPDPKKLVIATLDNYSFPTSQTYDPVHNIFYSIIYSDATQNLSLHTLNMSNPSSATRKTLSCSIVKLWCLKYDPNLQKLVAIVDVWNKTSWEEVTYHAAVLEADGSCTVGAKIPGVDIISASTYDPVSATFYLCSVSYTAFELVMFDTKTSTTTVVELSDILNYMEVAF